MTTEEAVQAVMDALDALRIPYMVVGSFASNYYGIARSTADADFVIQLGSEPVTLLAGRLGPAFRLDPQSSFETTTMTRRHVLEVVGISFQIELFHIGDDPYDQERFVRRKQVKMLGREVPLLTAEDVVVTKLRWVLSAARPKDREDVRAVLAVQGQNIDWSYVHRWCDVHGTRELLDEIRRSLSTP